MSDDLNREQWCLVNQMSTAIQCLNSIFCAEVLEKPVVERHKTFEKEIVRGIAKKCSKMMLEDAIDILSQALVIRKIEKKF